MVKQLSALHYVSGSCKGQLSLRSYRAVRYAGIDVSEELTASIREERGSRFLPTKLAHSPSHGPYACRYLLRALLDTNCRSCRYSSGVAVSSLKLRCAGVWFRAVKTAPSVKWHMELPRGEPTPWLWYSKPATCQPNTCRM